MNVLNQSMLLQTFPEQYQLSDLISICCHFELWLFQGLCYGEVRFILLL